VVIATLALGFADGYSRNNSNTVVGYGKGATVVIGGRKCVVAGKVCMDMMMVNCGPGTPESLGVRVGDYAILYGTGGTTLKEHADNLGTAQSDVTCDLGRRVRREYINAPHAQAGKASIVRLAREFNEQHQRSGRSLRHEATEAILSLYTEVGTSKGSTKTSHGCVSM
jgi:hypothetical protein